MTRQWAILVGQNLVEASGWDLEIANLKDDIHMFQKLLKSIKIGS